ncbi:ATP binding cassette (ABC) transporter subfamily A member, partial [Diabrotica virgifera virgifera]
MSAESNSNRKRNHSYTVLQDGSDIGFQEPRGR